MTVSPFTNGQTLTSTALSQSDLHKVVQRLTLGVLGLDPAQDAQAYAKVRIGWTLQPGWKTTDNLCSIRATEDDDPYGRVRDRKVVAQDSSQVSLVDTYTRVWRISFTFYGPASFEQARLLKSALFQDWTHEQLAVSHLYLITELRASTRAPELFEGQWWDRTDCAVSLNEHITEVLTVPSMHSAEALLSSSPDGLQADLQAQA